jgi:hypothetical protein
MLRSLATAGFLVVVGLLAFRASAFAMGPPVVNQTDHHLVNETSTQLDVHPCTGVPVELTLVETGVIHFSAFADGTVHFTGTLRGTFSADALPTDGRRRRDRHVHDLVRRQWAAAGGGRRDRQGPECLHAQRPRRERRWLDVQVPPERQHRLRRNGVPKLEFFKARCR